MAVIELEPSYIEPSTLEWSNTELFGLPFVHFGSFVENQMFPRTDNMFGLPFQHHEGFFGIEAPPPSSAIKAGVNYGFNNSLTGSLSISTEQWS